MSVDLSLPHFTVVLDERLGEDAVLKQAKDGEVYLVVHPDVAEEDSPARAHGHVLVQRAVDMVMPQRKTHPTADSTD